MTKKDLTTITVEHKTRPVRTEEWDLMPIGTTFIHPVDGHLCLKASDTIMFDFEDKSSTDVKEEHGVIWDWSTEDPIEFELVDISVTAKEK